MIINIFNFLPVHDTIVSVDKDLLKFMFSKIEYKTLSDLSHKLNDSIKNMSRYRNGTRGIPYHKLIKILNLSGMQINELQDKINVKVGKGGTSISFGPYIEITDKWVYISELIRGDGHIPRSLWSIQFINKEKKLIDITKEFFINVGLPKESIDLRKTKTDVYQLYVRSNLLSYIFTNFFEIPVGNKSSIIEFPEFIKNNKNFAIAAARGFFDAEGTVTMGSKNHLTPRRISIASNSLFYLEGLKAALYSLGIEARIKKEKARDLYRLHITHQSNLRKFYELIGSNHPGRKSKLEKLLKTFSDKRQPEGEFGLKVLDLIKNGNKKRIDILKHVSVSSASVGWQLKCLKNQNLIKISKKVYTNNGSYYEYEITRDGLNLLNEQRSFS